MEGQNKRTPLHAAAAEGHQEVCHMLVQVSTLWLYYRLHLRACIYQMSPSRKSDLTSQKLKKWRIFRSWVFIHFLKLGKKCHRNGENVANLSNNELSWIHSHHHFISLFIYLFICLKLQMVEWYLRHVHSIKLRFPTVHYGINRFTTRKLTGYLNSKRR